MQRENSCVPRLAGDEDPRSLEAHARVVTSRRVDLPHLGRPAVDRVPGRELGKLIAGQRYAALLRMQRQCRRVTDTPLGSVLAPPRGRAAAVHRRRNTEGEAPRLDPSPRRLGVRYGNRTRRVRTGDCGGTFRFRNRLLYLANAMVDQQIGLEETDDGVWAIHFNTILLATFDEHDYIITG